MTVEKWLVVLGTFAAVAYLVIGVVGGVWPSHWDESGAADQIIWIALLVGGGVLLLAGLRISRRSPWVAAALISLGAVAGAVAIFWTIVSLVLAAALVVLSIVYARRTVGPSLAPN